MEATHGDSLAINVYTRRENDERDGKKKPHHTKILNENYISHLYLRGNVLLEWRR